MNLRFEIPPGAENHEVSQSRVADRGHVADDDDAAHARARQGHDSTSRTIPTAARRSLLSVPKYDFDWQTATSWPSRSCCRRARSSR